MFCYSFCFHFCIRQKSFISKKYLSITKYDNQAVTLKETLRALKKMDQTVEEKTAKKLLEIRKQLEKEIDIKKTLLNTIAAENEELAQENNLLEKWLLKF
ncbi:hypothetical protein M153_6330003057 [Pseudoloma neurophilia]|uniref:Uncharacterized protein n=1 Tax=Pseudoloma neurophilia TaxID=146866 RepID=A0A0R0M264_9MICR|nr:hypothetical protein M153_6330003057 [Pseudoloma neurophilia]